MELEQIQERYMSCLRSFVEHSAPQQPSRFHDRSPRQVARSKFTNTPETLIRMTLFREKILIL